jgi:hypothetical protein
MKDGDDENDDDGVGGGVGMGASDDMCMGAVDLDECG